MPKIDRSAEISAHPDKVSGSAHELDGLSDSVYVHLYPDPSVSVDSNKGYIVCDKYVVVVDATYLLNNIRSDLNELRKITNREVRCVINTHYHSDHSYGNCLFSCEIIAHTKCLELMKQEKERQLSDVFEEVKDPRDRKLIGNVRYPTVLFEESYELDSHPRIEVVHLGGHTPDLSVVRVPEERVLFASDDMFGSPDPSVPIHPVMNERSDLNAWLAALKMIVGMDIDFIIPGHLGLCDKQAVNRLIDYLQCLITNIRQLREQGYSKEEVKRRPELLNLPKVALENQSRSPEILEDNIETQFDRV